MSGPFVPRRADATIVVDVVAGLAAAGTVDEGFERLARGVEALGFGSTVYAAIPLTLNPGPYLEPVFLVSSGFSAGYLGHYVEAGLDRHDFTIERIRAGRLEPMDWQRERRGRRLTELQAGHVDLARVDYGLRQGLSVPTRGDAHVIAGASVTCDETDVRFERLQRERLGTLRALVRLFDDWVFAGPGLRHRFYSSLVARFSADEAAVIRLVIGGHRLKSAPERCGLSASRAGNVLSALYRRLGIANASELAYLAGVHDLGRLL